jgi:hypothetical protein
MPVIPVTQEAAIERIKVLRLAWEKIYRPPISKNALGTVVHVCNLSYTRGIGRTLASPGKNCKTLFEKIA